MLGNHVVRQLTDISPSLCLHHCVGGFQDGLVVSAVVVLTLVLGLAVHTVLIEIGILGSGGLVPGFFLDGVLQDLQTGHLILP